MSTSVINFCENIDSCETIRLPLGILKIKLTNNRSIAPITTAKT